ncbi:DUF5610 domain-containing protein [Agaribacterium haliotis]|uniref:DUF5610 domain-containing protein n=1 Tax=Agaribacterium haliotis TaxID=2013869 RepID=UPI000BB54112|nr:DUF5610 domain-containing protein [Agaribacterium haliotis]
MTLSTSNTALHQRNHYQQLQYQRSGSGVQSSQRGADDGHTSAAGGAGNQASEASAYSQPASKALEGSGRTDAANTILAFINGRLQIDAAEGASDEQLVSRLEAGLQGFLQGYHEAYEQLSALAMLYPEVEEAIEQTFSDVLDGIDAIAEDLGIASPVTDQLREQQAERRATAKLNSVEAEPLPVFSAPAQAGETRPGGNSEADNLRSLIEASSFDYRRSESRSFAFDLTTKDGDRVQIRAAYAQGSVLQGQKVAYGDETLSGSFHAAAGFYLDIQGELDDDELAAIEDLLTQVREVSDLFFNGDINAAFEHASELGFNSEEIARFSLKLRYEYSAQTDTTYASAPAKAEATGEPFDKHDEQLMLLARFVQALEDMRHKSQALGLFSALPEQLVEQSGAQAESVMAQLIEDLDALA